MLTATLIASAAGCASDDAAAPAGASAAASAAIKPSGRDNAARPGAALGLPRFIRVLPGDSIGVPLSPPERAIKAGVVSVKIGQVEVLAPISRIEPVSDQRAGIASDDEPAARAARWWVGSGAGWRSARGAGAGQWVALVPSSAIEDQDRPASMLVEGQLVALDWRPADRAMTDALLDAAPELSPLLTRATDVLMASPEERWRAKLASGRPLGIDEDAPIADPAVAALARHEEGQWLSALERLWRLDRPLCLALATRLRMVVDSADDAGWAGAAGAPGERVPLWPADRATLLSLRERLTDLKATDALAASAANALLAGQPAALAVVLDDGGSLGDDRVPLPAVWAATMLAEPVAARVRAAGSPGGEELVRLEPMTARRIYASRLRPSDEEGPGPLARPARAAVGAGSAGAGAQLRVSVGEWAATRSAVASLVPARPPGVSIGPMFLDWTMATLLEAGAEPSGSAALRRAAPGGPLDLAGRLYREPGEGGPAAARWTLYLECRRAGGNASPAGDMLQIFLGPWGVVAPTGRNAAIALRVGIDGSLSVRAGGPEAAWAEAGRVRVAGAASPNEGSSRGRWSAWVPIPPAAIPADGVLQIGLVRLAADGLVGSEGTRSAWPRPMLPWADEPGRIAIDLRSWGQAGGPGPGEQ